jgi:hypothetical protein
MRQDEHRCPLYLCSGNRWQTLTWSIGTSAFPDQRATFGCETLWKKQAIGRGRLAALGPTEYFQQAVQERGLAFQDLKSRLGNAKPGRAVELRK